MGAFEGKSKAKMHLICSLDSEQKHHRKQKEICTCVWMSGIKSKDFSNIHANNVLDFFLLLLIRLLWFFFVFENDFNFTFNFYI